MTAEYQSTLPCQPNVVISGVSCRLPESDNMREFRDNLMNNVDMVTDDYRRWKPGIHGLPTRSGKLKDLSRFDAAFFGIHQKQANRMAPQIRMLLEVAYEAIMDSGVNPEDIRGSRTGVFIGSSESESHQAWTMDPEETVGYTMTGSTQFMFSNRLSYYFDFKGPSFTIDSACSSSLLALDEALRSIRGGQCDAAIVGGSSVQLNPTMAVQFLKLGMLSPDGMCKSFDAEGNGYCRSEGVTVLYIQRETDARRIYCTLVHSKSKSDGYKEQGITFPSGEVQTELLQEIYNEAGIPPSHVTYVEAHGTGTRAGDPQETNAICDVFCKDRQWPLCVGAVKSNMGHSEANSGLSAVAKVLIAMEEKTIPANLHYNSPNPDIPGLTDGRLQVVGSNRQWHGGLVGVNSFGLGGTNVHVVLRSNSMKAVSAEGTGKKRLFTYAARTEESLHQTLRTIRQHPQDLHLHSLMYETANMSASTHPFRGYTVLNGEQGIDVKRASTDHRPVWLVFGGMGSQWQGMGRAMLEIDVFRESILKSDSLVRPLGVPLYDMLMHREHGTFDTTVHCFVGIVSIQIALVDMLTCMGVRPDGILGHSVGELGCAYADGCLTAEETVLAAYWRGHCIQTAELPPGAMAAVGLMWQEALSQCPEGVVAACHNSPDTVTVSGPADIVRTFVQDLKDRGVFAKEVNTTGVAFHSHYMNVIAPTLKDALEKVIRAKRVRSSRWISSSVPESDWSSELAQFSSVDYLVNNLVSPVLFQEALSHVPSNAVVIEIAPHCLLQAILKRTLTTDCGIVGLMKKDHADNVEFCLSALGKCYQMGVTLNPLKLHPSVSYPVPPGTPMISPILHWDHAQSWDVPTADSFTGAHGRSGCGFDIDMSPDSENNYLIGHKIDGRAMFPATGYLTLVWKTLAKQERRQYDQMSIRFDDVTFHRATLLPSHGNVHFDVNLMPGTCSFEVMEGGAVVASGRVASTENQPVSTTVTAAYQTAESFDLCASDVYTILRLRGYDYGPAFQGITAASMSGGIGRLLWNGHWISFLDTMLQMAILSHPGRGLELPTRIKSMSVDACLHTRLVEVDEGTELEVRVNHNCNTCVSGGVRMLGLHATPVPRHDIRQPILERHEFVPYSSVPAVPAKALLDYANKCSIRAAQGLRDLITLNNSCNPDQLNHLQSVIKLVSFVQSEADKESVFDNIKQHSLLATLNQIFSNQNSEKVADRSEDIEKSQQIAMNTDCLLSYLHQADILKSGLDIVVENVPSRNIRIFEVADSGMATQVLRLLHSHPLLQPAYTVAVGRDPPDHRDTVLDNHVVTTTWAPDQPYPPGTKKVHLAIAKDVLRKEKNIRTELARIAATLEESGFILVQEVTQNFHISVPLDGMCENIDCDDINERTCSIYCDCETWKKIFQQEGFEVLYERSDSVMSSMFLLRRSVCYPDTKPTLVNVSDVSCSWVEELKEKLAACQARPRGHNLWLLANEQVSGVLGLVTSLRLEPGGERIRCIYTDSAYSDMDLSTVVSEKLLARDLVMNVRQNGQWGSYRHLPLSEVESVDTDHAYVDVQTRGDLSTLRWIQSSLRHIGPAADAPTTLCMVHYASLNFRDVMLATGRLPPDAIPGDAASRDCLLGMEFSGTDNSDRRLMGLVPAKGLATTVVVHKDFLWDVPETWTLEEAATVPLVYTTAYYALVVRGNIRHGNTVLIHSGSGGVGQAAISIALHLGCTVFTTVGSTEKRAYLLSRFPQLRSENFFNSRDTLFEEGILEATLGKGVDVVLNSLTEDKLQSSLRVLAQHGRFLEIGKFDLANNTALGMSAFLKNISVHGILLDALFEPDNDDWATVSTWLTKGMASGTVRPLKTTVFGRDDVEGAFRHMSQGKHVGKVMIKVRSDVSPEPRCFAIPRAACYPDKTYVITGGLGGVGLELADWLTDRGARHLILTSRSGVRTGYQRRKLEYIRGRGAEVTVSLLDVCDVTDVRALLQGIIRGPVGGIFHLAMVLMDGLLENQTVENFRRVCEPKVMGTMNLDHVTREICKACLDWFVVVSSRFSGHGHAGQSNYGFANSVMERICEQRNKDGLPGLAIQWGPIGDVGVILEAIGDNETVIAGNFPQRIPSVLATLDRFLAQREPVVSGFLLADKETCVGKDIQLDLVHAVLHIIGVADEESVNPDTSLTDLGFDSLMAVEIKQTLERDYNITMAMGDIRQLCITKLKHISDAEVSTDVNARKQTDANNN